MAHEAPAQVYNHCSELAIAYILLVPFEAFMPREGMGYSSLHPAVHATFATDNSEHLLTKGTLKPGQGSCIPVFHCDLICFEGGRKKSDLLELSE